MQGCRVAAWKAVLAVLLAVLIPGFTGTGGTDKVCRARVRGTIGPATASYLARAIAEAAGQEAQCLVIELDTPGGLLDSTREIVQSLLRSPVPTVVYVAPQGGWAGSAGCFITLAADLAAMAPGTSIGAAHPVGLGPGGEKTDQTMKQKLENFSSSYLEAVAARRHRNAAWAAASVRESAALTADQALAGNVVDFVAADLPDLLRQIDGREVNGRRLQTARASIADIPMTAAEKVFQAVAHPQVMLILMLVVIYGLIGELTSPGAILPGVAGTIALVLLLYLASVLPINAAGLAMIVVAVLLFIIDVFAPTHGILTAGGLVAFFLGTMMLFDRGEPFLRLSLAWTLPATVVTGLFFTFIVGAGLRAQRLPARAGAETLIGGRARALERIDAAGGRLFLEGEYWRAVAAEPIEVGRTVEVVAREGLTLRVKPEATEAPP
jgi:membrane-bound serine protease (ClpP class)